MGIGLRPHTLHRPFVDPRDDTYKNVLTSHPITHPVTRVKAAAMLIVEKPQVAESHEL